MSFHVPTVKPSDPPVPTGNYRMKVASVKDLGMVANPHEAGKERWRMLIDWDVEMRDGSTMRQKDYQTVSFYKLANLPKIARALRVPIVPPADADLEQFVGRTCNGAIEAYTSADGTLRSKIREWWPVEPSA